MKPEIWGPRFWFIIHVSSFRYPEKPDDKDKDTYRTFYYSLANGILPCPICRQHFRKYLDNPENHFEESLQSNKKLVKFFWKLHNDVNKRTNKDELSFGDFLVLYKSYEMGLEPCYRMQHINLNIKTLLTICGSFIIGGALVYYLTHK
jgi:hypothetical protein